MPPDKQLVRAALMVQRILQDRGDSRFGQIGSSAEMIEYYTSVLKSQVNLQRLAGTRGWRSAAVQVQRNISYQLSRLSEEVAVARSRVNQPAPVMPPLLRELVLDLCQLHDELDELEIDLNAKVISAVTVSITLADVPLGPFRIELHVQRMCRFLNSDCFRIIALDPNPAAKSQDITHPHVRDETICPGEAADLIADALTAGRICDAFLAINGILTTYNRRSPYLPLEEWSGAACADCGETVAEDRLTYCEHCREDYCDDCTSCCEICDSSCCSGCLKEDAVSERRCCPNCRHTCRRCERIVDSESFDEESGLCPGCLEHDQTPNQEQDHEQESSDHSRAPGDPGGEGSARSAAEADAVEASPSQAPVTVG